MISYLRGTVRDIQMESMTLDVNGVGYELLSSQWTLGSVELEQNLEVSVHTHVREDVLQLFGFLNKVEKQVFLSLLKVNGVGPKMAIQILSGVQVKDLLILIENEDVKGLSRLPKIGKKKAEQIILTLKGKLKIIDAPQREVQPVVKTEVVSALVNLGFKLSDVEKVVSEIPEELTLEEKVREGLTALTSI